MAKDKVKDNVVAQNKKAHYDYEITETFEAGIVLTGTEIKSVRQARINIRDGFARVRNGEVWLSNVHISPFDEGNIWNVDPTRSRKLLLHKKQIAKIEAEISQAGMSFVPLRVYVKDGFAKVLMGLAKGKKNYDKRETIKRKEQNRDIAKQLKAFNR
ncbi:SsrA-binding protein SmpB [Pseudolactococcus chungangensis]|jgi:SsrA-binding protein|uniref:SsrA-binding protein n=2 Tax=Pseudolactococcus chungangensis TaxID=451457 RepID=A0A1K2H2R5_9LACT|nr:SsrA-binding protein SmpB [Lactococcus chungangensis]NCB81450.1 SsrA-binding protein SmpB [Bacilli bacterium]MDD3014938.1 SsrA-binding protein SmpB [Lactococcus chungangensis]NLH35648.1 SsrA-binding protein SmpB [Lactococcus chungangensis]PCS01792.1 single-stranded DNA-binding protein [Lactococcus chungangensis CAU 28 = DSM 22330]SFZ70051.1 SsrA-binding protein [Lactococcus chungangensis CAU 28 = DSM 22330]